MDNVSVPSSRVKKSKKRKKEKRKDGADTLYRNVGKRLPFDAA
jgi:hypothetical protein